MATSTSATRFMFKTTKVKWEEDYIEIKLQGKTVGKVTMHEGGSCGVSFMAWKEHPEESNNPNCPWQWVNITRVYTSLEELKDHLNSNFDKFMDLRIQLYMQD